MRISLALAGVLFLVSSGCPGRGSPTVAEVNGHRITAAELQLAIPKPVAAGREAEARSKTLTDLINRRLVLQEAVRLGLDSAPGFELYAQSRGVVIQAFLRARVERLPKITEADLKQAWELSRTQVRIRVLSAATESTARFVEQELARGVPFETLAFYYSQDGSRRHGGEIAPVDMSRFPEPIRGAILKLEPGQHTAAIPYGGAWEFVQLLARMPADPPPFAESRDRIRQFLQSQRERKATMGYVDSIRSATVYDEETLRLLLAPADAVSPAAYQRVVATCSKAESRTASPLAAPVRVADLIDHRRLTPAGLDTAALLETLRREVTTVLLYRVALAERADRRPDVRRQLADVREGYLYNTTYRREVIERCQATDSEAVAYYRQHPAEFAGKKLTPDLQESIRTRLSEDRYAPRYAAWTAELRGRARIVVNEAVLDKVPVTDPPAAKKGPAGPRQRP